MCWNCENSMSWEPCWDDAPAWERLELEEMLDDYELADQDES